MDNKDLRTNLEMLIQRASNELNYEQKYLAELEQEMKMLVEHHEGVIANLKNNLIEMEKTIPDFSEETYKKYKVYYELSARLAKITEHYSKTLEDLKNYIAKSNTRIEDAKARIIKYQAEFDKLKEEKVYEEAQV